MIPTRLTLDDSFEAVGKWWLPEKPETILHGSVKFSSDCLTLILSGGFKNRPMDGTIARDFERYPVVHGLSDDGKQISLLNVIVTDTSGNLQETTQTECSAIHLLVGGHAPAVGEFKLKSMSFGCSHLDAFLNRIGFSVDIQGTDIDFRGLTAAFTKPENIDFRIEAITAKLQIDSELSIRRRAGGTSLTLVANSFFDLTPDVPQSLDYFIRNVWRLCYLLTLLTNESVSPEWIRVETENSSAEQWLLYRSIKRRSNGQSDVSALLLLQYGHCHAEFPGILDKWFSASDALVSAIHLFMNAQRNNGPSLEPRFLTATQGVEAFSRATTSSFYMPEDQYRTEVAPALVDAIPEVVCSHHRESLIKRIQFANEHSFRKRITSLLKSLSSLATDCVCASVQNFMDGLVDTRNYLTHYPDALRPKALTGVDLSWATEKLLMLLRILLLKHIGIKEDLIALRVKSHPMLMQHILIWKQFRESLSD
jgi:hypothetical protein